MNNVLAFVGLCVVLAVLRAAAIALIAGLLLTLLFAFMRHPRDTLGFLGCLGLLGVVGAFPIVGIAILGAVAIAWALSGSRRKPDGPMLLEDGRDHH